MASRASKGFLKHPHRDWRVSAMKGRSRYRRRAIVGPSLAQEDELILTTRRRAPTEPVIVVAAAVPSFLIM